MLSLWRLLRHTVWPPIWAVIDRFNRDQGSVLAGYLAYAAMLSLLPFLVFAAALTGFVVGPENSTAALDTLFQGIPDHVAQTLEPVVLEVLAQRRGGILTLSAVGAMWAASNGVEALRVGFDHAYDVQHGRHIAVNRLFSLGYVLIGYVIFAVLALLIVLAPLVFRLAELILGIDVPFAAEALRFIVALSVLWIALWAAHRLLPARRMRHIRLWPGLLASTILIALLAVGMSVYLEHAPSYSLTYGTLAGVILSLLFFYFCGAALILGAQVNAVVNADRLAAPRPGVPDAAPDR